MHCKTCIYLLMQGKKLLTVASKCWLMAFQDTLHQQVDPLRIFGKSKFSSQLQLSAPTFALAAAMHGRGPGLREI